MRVFYRFYLFYLKYSKQFFTPVELLAGFLNSGSATSRIVAEHTPETIARIVDSPNHRPIPVRPLAVSIPESVMLLHTPTKSRHTSTNKVHAVINGDFFGVPPPALLTVFIAPK